MSENDDVSPETLAARAAMERLFPVDSTAHTARLLGMQKRGVDRMWTGYSNTPPRIVDKLDAQSALKEQFVAALNALIDDAERAGTHPLVLKYALVDAARGGRFEKEFEPL